MLPDSFDSQEVGTIKILQIRKEFGKKKLERYIHVSCLIHKVKK